MEVVTREHSALVSTSKNEKRNYKAMDDQESSGRTKCSTKSEHAEVKSRKFAKHRAMQLTLLGFGLTHPRGLPVAGSAGGTCVACCLNKAVRQFVTNIASVDMQLRDGRCPELS